jgi:aminopeptidase N
MTKQLFLATFVLVFGASALADNFSEQIDCKSASSFFATADPSVARQYAPSREVDILHLKLDVTPDFKQRTVSGTATFTFKPIAKPLEELSLDAVDLSVASVTSTEKIESYQVTF